MQEEWLYAGHYYLGIIHMIPSACYSEVKLMDSLKCKVHEFIEKNGLIGFNMSTGTCYLPLVCYDNSVFLLRNVCYDKLGKLW